MDHRELHCKEGTYKGAGEDPVQWWVLALSLLYLLFVLPKSNFFRSGENTIYSAAK